MSAQRTFCVTLPIAGHAYVTVEAESEEEAIQKAFDEVTISHVEEWEALSEVNRGNVCRFPQPWKPEVTEE